MDNRPGGALVDDGGPLPVRRGTIGLVTLLLLLLTVAVVGAVAAVASGAITGGLDDPVTTVPARALPQGPPTPRDIAALRFVPALRGYRMDQVDAAMDRLAGEVERLHREIAERDRRLTLAGAPGFGPDRPVPESGPDRPLPGGPPDIGGTGGTGGTRGTAGTDDADDPGDTEAEHGPATGGFTPRPARDPDTAAGGLPRVTPDGAPEQPGGPPEGRTGPPEGFGPSWREEGPR